ncbi:hypothetical protein AMTR_s00002p00186190 [Amborella trichopoda]|uniref:CCHC-type domain-containing protein n=1 Tax=Amborella trichopoda TaxID=13333 RepID=W1P0K4_AMBTC|nr:hypothetical protein AMTR_s00002p00186190 [Amborella trichopoda]
MTVYCKFKSAKHVASLAIEGDFINVLNLKRKIFTRKNLRRDDDLFVFNSKTNEQYVDEALVPKHSSLLLGLVPKRRRFSIIVTEIQEPKSSVLFRVVSKSKRRVVPIVTEKQEPKTSKTPQTINGWDDFGDDEVKLADEPDWHDFGDDLHSTPIQSSQALSNKANKDSSIKGYVHSNDLVWRQKLDGHGFGRGRGFRQACLKSTALVWRRQQRGGGFEDRTPPQDYVCHRCNTPGHFIKHCPTNGNPNFDIKRVIPACTPDSMATPDCSHDPLSVNSYPKAPSHALSGNAKSVDTKFETTSKKEPVSVESGKEEVQHTLPAGEQRVKKRKKICDPIQFQTQSSDFMAPSGYNPFLPQYQWAMDGYILHGNPYFQTPLRSLLLLGCYLRVLLQYKCYLLLSQRGTMPYEVPYTDSLET